MRLSLRTLFPFPPSTRALHAATYLLALPLTSIALLVFLNSSLSFLLTNLFHIPPSRLGSIVGTLGFVDELVAVVAAPVWGLISDTRVGTRGVSVAGYIAIAISLLLFVELQTVYPGLVIARIVFSIGAAAVTTMVTAILPEMTKPTTTIQEQENDGTLGRKVTGRIAGMVGMLSGVGALFALGVLLPLPTRFSEREEMTPGQAIRVSYVIVATLAAFVSIWCVFGLPPPRKRQASTWMEVKAWVWHKIWGGDPSFFGDEVMEAQAERERSMGLKGLWKAAKVAGEDGRILAGYVGGFVARASSVGVSLFIPLWVNWWFVSTGRCQTGERKHCSEAYKLAAVLTGTSQLTALLLAPIFGILTDRSSASPHLRNIPLLLSSVLGILSFSLFASLPSPSHPGAFIISALAGASQIGAIVASLGLLSQAVVDYPSSSSSSYPSSPSSSRSASDRTPLLNGAPIDRTHKREYYKGSIAGVYSLAGAAAILLLTKAGGIAFDKNPGAPFWMLAAFNGVLMVVGVGEMVVVRSGWRR
ncbi:MFS general substrate transporter [Ascodesmis nigricans]|uniref:MFS general substrate transporter n=1 Tax=Ascodesmis nigricans TaxID=341454 RepID=A0A4S2MTW3_9PEZI|nr:MFS general substrate transporter [Ascodesmis nigricans]